jgi:hypothetical protein
MNVSGRSGNVAKLHDMLQTRDSREKFIAVF